jgi:hypothetical protein
MPCVKKLKGQLLFAKMIKCENDWLYNYTPDDY